LKKHESDAKLRFMSEHYSFEGTKEEALKALEVYYRLDLRLRTKQKFMRFLMPKEVIEQQNNMEQTKIQDRMTIQLGYNMDTVSKAVQAFELHKDEELNNLKKKIMATASMGDAQFDKKYLPNSEGRAVLVKEAEKIKVTFNQDGTVDSESWIKIDALKESFKQRIIAKPFKMLQDKRRELLGKSKSEYDQDDYAVLVLEELAGGIICEGFLLENICKQLKVPMSVYEKSMQTYMKDREVQGKHQHMLHTIRAKHAETPEEYDEQTCLQLAELYHKLRIESQKKIFLVATAQRLP
jgi:hypothetical protein